MKVPKPESFRFHASKNYGAKIHHRVGWWVCLDSGVQKNTPFSHTIFAEHIKRKVADHVEDYVWVADTQHTPSFLGLSREIVCN